MYSGGSPSWQCEILPLEREMDLKMYPLTPVKIEWMLRSKITKWTNRNLGRGCWSKPTIKKRNINMAQSKNEYHKNKNYHNRYNVLSNSNPSKQLEKGKRKMGHAEPNVGPSNTTKNAASLSKFSSFSTRSTNIGTNASS